MGEEENVASDELYLRWFLASLCQGPRADHRDIVEFVMNVLPILRGVPRPPDAPSWHELEILGEQILAELDQQVVF